MRTAVAIIATALALALPWANAYERSSKQKREFAKRTACPATGLRKLPCPGFVIDHVEALDCGGLDHWTNMQWQTVAEAKAKDRWERIGCRKGKRVVEELRS